MTRADAIRDLIARLEAGEEFGSDAMDAACCVSTQMFCDFPPALRGSLDAVARLETPLRQRGWTSYVNKPDHIWRAVLWRPSGDPVPTVRAEGDTEARARLLAVLRALLSEEQP